MTKPRFKNHYDRRDHNLRRLGFANYREYLASDLWREVKRKVFARKGRKCCVCGGFAQTLHHTRYTQKVLQGEDISKLKPICHACHQYIEFDDDNRKVKISGANRRMHRKRKQHTHQFGNRENGVARPAEGPRTP